MPEWRHRCDSVVEDVVDECTNKGGTEDVLASGLGVGATKVWGAVLATVGARVGDAAGPTVLVAGPTRPVRAVPTCGGGGGVHGDMGVDIREKGKVASGGGGTPADHGVGDGGGRHKGGWGGRDRG